MTHGKCSEAGFTLVEALIAMLIMCFGLLAAGQMIFIAAGSGSLSRSQDAATVAAQDKIELLTDLYGRDPNTGELAIGLHGPEQVTVRNQATNAVLNRFNVAWTVTLVTDPRPGKVLKAKQVSVSVIPVDENGNRHVRINLNKVVVMTALFSARTT